MSDQLANIERELGEYKSAAQIAADALAALRADVTAKLETIQAQLAEIAALSQGAADFEAYKARIEAISQEISDTTDGLLAAAQPAEPAEPEPEQPADPAPEEPAPVDPDAPPADGEDQGNNSEGDDPPPPTTTAPVDPEDNPEVKTSDKQGSGNGGAG